MSSSSSSSSTGFLAVVGSVVACFSSKVPDSMLVFKWLGASDDVLLECVPVAPVLVSAIAALCVGDELYSISGEKGKYDGPGSSRILSKGNDLSGIGVRGGKGEM